MDGSAGWAGSISLANPFAIFNDDLIGTRDLDLAVIQREFDDFARFILEDLKTFFDEYREQIGSINWAQVKTVMVIDRDIDYFPIGSIFYKKLVDIV